MNKNAIRISELVAALVLFEVGSTTLYLLGAKARQDAWLTMVIGACGGFLLLLMYLWIFRLDSRRDLYELCTHYLGKIPGGAVGLLFAGYFTYEASRVVRDLSELTTITLLDRTPIAVISLITTVVVSNTVRYGPKNIFVIAVVLLPVTAVGYAFLTMAAIASGNFHLEYMEPILENGFLPVWKTAFPSSITFPFGQVVVFLVFFKLLPVSRKKLNKVVVMTYGVVALILIVLNEMNIWVLGPKLAPMFTYPLLEVVRLVQIARVLERLDALFALVLFLGLGTKIVIFFSGAAIGLSRVTNLKYKAGVVILGVIIYVITLTPPTYTEYIWTGLNFLVVWVWPVFQFALPLLLLLIMLIRKKKRQQQPDETTPAAAERA